MLWLVRFFIRAYQCTLSPVLRLLCGPDLGCRFTPSCSAYFMEAVELHGIRHGSWLGLKRLARCQPWGGWGYDPVPKTAPSLKFQVPSSNIQGNSNNPTMPGRFGV